MEAIKMIAQPILYAIAGGVLGGGLIVLMHKYLLN